MLRVTLKVVEGSGELTELLKGFSALWKVSECDAVCGDTVHIVYCASECWWHVCLGPYLVTV